MPASAEIGSAAGATPIPATAEVGSAAGATATVPVERPVPACPPKDGLVEYVDGGPGYPPRQVVITGLEDEVTSVIMDIDPSGDVWEWVRDIPLPDNPKQISLYCIPDSPDLPVAARAFNQSAQMLFGDDPPRAEPNYFIQPPNGLYGYPNGGSGAIGGAPASPPYILANASNLTHGNFLANGLWLRLRRASASACRTRHSQAVGVRVAVFDTSPYTASARASYVGGSLWVTALVDEFGTYDFDHNPVRGDEHGLFVASLVQAVAPGSDLQLLQILDGELRGSVFSMIHAIDLYHREFVVPSTAAATPVVVNLSLGFEAEAVNTGESEVVSLRTMLESYERQGYIFVAAAGNAGRDTTFQPASYSSVLAVAANTNIGERACFSNFGQVAAPGGGRSLSVTAEEIFRLAAFPGRADRRTVGWRHARHCR